MKERPILFSGPMVKAILDGKKTQTRRIVKPMAGLQSKWLAPDLISDVPHGEIIDGGWQMHHPKAGTTHTAAGITVDEPYDSPLGWIRCPYGKPGDRLWVRETFTPLPGPKAIFYNADNVAIHYMDQSFRKYPVGGPRKPSIFMPRWACRIFLEITGVRVQRLNDISEEDAKAEGCEAVTTYRYIPGEAVKEPDYESPALDEFRGLWNQINGKKHPWSSNPWTWVIEFSKQ
jgi:hypothetical protein